MFRLFEKVLNPTYQPARTEPPTGLAAFYWHYARQAKGLFIALFAVGFVVALLDSMIPVFMGRVVTLVTSSDPALLWRAVLAHAPRHGGCVAVPAPGGADGAEPRRPPGDLGERRQHDPVAEPLVRGAAVLGVLPERLRRTHRDAGAADRAGGARVARRPHHRRLVHPGLRHERADPAGSADRWLALPIRLWFVGYLVLLRVFVPRMRDRSKEVSEARSMLTGRIVDTYTNILTVKLFARARNEDAYVRDAIDEHTGLFHASLRLNTLFSFCLSTLNAMLVTGTGAVADGAVGPRQGRGRHGGDGAAAVVADHQHRRLGGDADDRNLREYRRRAGRHDDDRAAASASTDRPEPATLMVTRGEIRSMTCGSAMAARVA